uniref:Uncharacterized protein n=1 Tax=Oryza sativa subsp. japonica TaxID=39947 RepID=Q6YVZ9_ORYSJ|nr:hypothetical protein [Oryza sativa Japonica Group]BAD31718.1 hypothetical protein [Oryza sativa Japonica Group]
MAAIVGPPFLLMKQMQLNFTFHSDAEIWLIKGKNAVHWQTSRIHINQGRAGHEEF